MGQSPPGHTYNKNGQGLPFYQGKIEFGQVYPLEPSTWCTEPKKIAEPDDEPLGADLHFSLFLTPIILLNNR